MAKSASENTVGFRKSLSVVGSVREVLTVAADRMACNQARMSERHEKDDLETAVSPTRRWNAPAAQVL